MEKVMKIENSSNEEIIQNIDLMSKKATYVTEEYSKIKENIDKQLFQAKKVALFVGVCFFGVTAFCIQVKSEINFYFFTAAALACASFIGIVFVEGSEEVMKTELDVEKEKVSSIYEEMRGFLSKYQNDKSDMLIGMVKAHFHDRSIELANTKLNDLCSDYNTIIFQGNPPGNNQKSKYKSIIKEKYHLISDDEKKYQLKYFELFPKIKRIIERTAPPKLVPSDIWKDFNQSCNCFLYGNNETQPETKPYVKLKKLGNAFTAEKYDPKPSSNRKWWLLNLF